MPGFRPASPVASPVFLSVFLSLGFGVASTGCVSLGRQRTEPASTIPTVALTTPQQSASQTSNPPIPGEPIAAHPSGVISVKGVQFLPEYRAAVTRFAHSGKDDIAAALETIRTLEKRPSLSAADKTFLARQKRICREALGSGSPTAHRVVVSNPPLTVTHAQNADCGPRALLLVCQALHRPADLTLLRKAAGTNKDGTTLAGLQQAARSVGLIAEGVQMDGDALAKLETPAIAWVNGNHYVAVLAVNADTATIQDPNQTDQETLPLRKLLSRSGGVLLTISDKKKTTERADSKGG